MENGKGQVYTMSGRYVSDRHQIQVALILDAIRAGDNIITHGMVSKRWGKSREVAFRQLVKLGIIVWVKHGVYEIDIAELQKQSIVVTQEGWDALLPETKSKRRITKKRSIRRLKKRRLENGERIAEENKPDTTTFENILIEEAIKND